MESYYNSDEEIAWGPRTLREIKGDLKRPVRKPNRRRTLASNFKMELPESSHMVYANTSAITSEDVALLSEEVTKKINVSPTLTEYYTPNESLQTDNNSDFLEKLSKVINEPRCLSTYALAKDDKIFVLKNNHDASITSTEGVNSSYGTAKNHITNMDDSYLNFIKIAPERRTSYDIANFEQSLIKSPLSEISKDEAIGQKHEEIFIVDEENSFNESGNSEISPIKEKEISKDSLVLVSDDEEFEQNIDKSEKSNNLKVPFNFIDDVNEKEDRILGGGPFRSLFTTTFSDDKLKDCAKKVNEDNLHPDLMFSEIGKLTAEKGAAQEEKVISDSTSILTQKNNMDASPISLPDIDLTQFDDSTSKSNSPRMNDTMEEMNRLLHQGLDYTLSDDESIIESTPLKNETRVRKFTVSSILPSSAFSTQIPVPASNSKQKRHNRFDIRWTPDNNFKIPEKPIRPKMPNPTPPKLYCNSLKNVISPVALYIKNSPCTPLKQKVPQRDLAKGFMPLAKTPKSSSKENFQDLPEVVYKPSKKQIVSSKKDVLLPLSIKRLNVKEPRLTKHEGRIQQPFDRPVVGKMLLQPNITDTSIDSSMLSDSKDVSVLTCKQAFIK